MKFCTSLESFCSDFSGACSRVTWEWCQYVHCRQQSDTFDDMADVWARCVAAEPNLQGAKKLLRFLLGRSSEAAVSFPGPLCSPLRKSDFCLLQSQPYLVTEKSDGVRIILASLEAEFFPCWEAADNMPFSLADVIQLEGARGRLIDNRAEVCIRGERCTLSANDDQGKEGSEHAVYVIQGDSAPGVPVRRRVAERQFAYFFDRAMSAVYVFHDEYKSDVYKNFLLDGELMYLYPRGGAEEDKEEANNTTCKAGLGFFDLFAYNTDRAPYLAINMGERALTDRLGMLESICLSVKRCASAPVLWFCKEMWPLEKLPECVSRISKRTQKADGGSHYYVFNRDSDTCSLNDGLIFTPDHFPITEGASMMQLKWKWMSMLSVDWLISPSRTREDEYKVSVYFLKKNFGHREDVARHWEQRPALKLLNPHKIQMHPTESVVAECTYDADRGGWCIERIRHDKKVANSVITIISVFECLAENLSLSNVVNTLTPDKGINSDRNPASSFLQLDTSGDRAASAAPKASQDSSSLQTKLRFAKMTLRAIKSASGAHTLVLSSYTPREDNINPIPFPVCDVEKRVELFDLPAVTDGTCIKNLLYMALGNAGGSEAWTDFVVDAFYDGDVGKWVVVHLHPHGDNKECTFQSVLQHLSWLIRIGGGNRARRYVPSKGAHSLTVALPSCVLPETNKTNAHYASKTRELSDTTGVRSPLRVFNNWIKSVLMHETVELVKRSTSTPLVVLDICCGRGGDLPKWKMYSPKFVFMTDSSIDCVGEAAARYSTGQGSVKTMRNQHSFDAHFAVFDAFDSEGGRLRGKIRALVRKKGMPFTVVSCQFSMHYGCYSKERLEYFVECVSAALGTGGGLFIGTTVSDEELLRRFRAHPSHNFGNGVYQVTFPPESVARLTQVTEGAEVEYGIVYQTSVENSVSELSEYVVPWSSFVKLCDAHGLTLAASFSFDDYYDKHRNTSPGKDLFEKALHRKRSRIDACTFQLTDDEREAVGIYRGFIFKKKERKEQP